MKTRKILEFNEKTQKLRLRSENVLCKNEKNWSDMDVFCSELEKSEIEIILERKGKLDVVEFGNEFRKMKFKNCSYKLHYANLDLKGEDIPVYGFEKISHLIDFVDKKYFEKSAEEKMKVVYLLSKDENVFVTESNIFLQTSLLTIKDIATTGNFHIQEYESFEDAYEVALMMKEDSPLCYSKSSQKTGCDHFYNYSSDKDDLCVNCGYPYENH